MSDTTQQHPAAEKAGIVGQAVFCGLDGFVHIQTGDGVVLPVKVTKESMD